MCLNRTDDGKGLKCQSQSEPRPMTTTKLLRPLRQCVFAQGKTVPPSLLPWASRIQTHKHSARANEREGQGKGRQQQNDPIYTAHTTTMLDSSHPAKGNQDPSSSVAAVMRARTHTQEISIRGTGPAQPFPHGLIK